MPIVNTNKDGIPDNNPPNVIDINDIDIHLNNLSRKMRWIRSCAIVPNIVHNKSKSYSSFYIPADKKYGTTSKLHELYSFSNHSLIFGEIYDLYDYNTIKKLKIKITYNYIDFISRNGLVSILEHLKNKNLITIDNFNIDYVTNVDSLEWWKNSGLPFTYSNTALRVLLGRNLDEALDWWTNSGLPLKYDHVILKSILDRCSTLTPKIRTWCRKLLNLPD
jgi:hypothetical protein